MDTHKAFKILNLNENASFAEAKKAYRCLAKQYHPDIAQARNQQCDDAKMKEINQAFFLLTPILRSKKTEAAPVKEQTAPGPQSRNVPPKKRDPDNAGPANENPADMHHKDEAGGWRAFFSRMMDKLSAGFGTTGSCSRQAGRGREKPASGTRGYNHKPSFDQVFKTVHQSPEIQKNSRPMHAGARTRISVLENYQTYMKFKKRISAAKKRQNRNVYVDRVEKINPVRPVAAVKRDE